MSKIPVLDFIQMPIVSITEIDIKFTRDNLEHEGVCIFNGRKFRFKNRYNGTVEAQEIGSIEYFKSITFNTLRSIFITID